MYRGIILALEYTGSKWTNLVLEETLPEATGNVSFSQYPMSNGIN